MLFTDWILLNEMPMKTGKGLALINENNSLLIIFQPTTTFKRIVKSADISRAFNFNTIIGVMEVRDNPMYETQEVQSVWAKKGYGPLLYMLAMTVSDDGLSPTRVSSQLSEPAKNIWNNFHSGKGKDFVASNDLQYQGKPANHHEEPHLNKKYKLILPYHEYEEMLERGKRFLSDDKYGEQRDFILELADGLLGEEMNKIY